MRHEDPNTPDAIDAQELTLPNRPAAVELLAMLSRTTKDKAARDQAVRLIRKYGPQAYLHHVATHDAPTFCALLGEVLTPNSEIRR
jgi:hypothetical protein